MAYAELHCISNYSFLRGASHPEELVARAHALGYTALALTDACSLSGVVRAHGKAGELGLQLLIGAELALDDGPRLVLLVTDRAAYAQLCRLVTKARRRAGKGSYSLQRADLEDAVPGCLALLVPALDEPDVHLEWFAATFAGRGWLALELVRDGNDRQRLGDTARWAREHGLRRVACGGVLMHARGRRALRDLLSAIRLNTPVAGLGHAALSNGERHLRDPDDLGTLYPPELLAETLRIARRCTFSLDEVRYLYPDDVTPAGRTPRTYLRELTEQGIARRWPRGCPQKVRAQVEHELALIAELEYEAYFLTVWDIVRFARGRDILCQGRGSAANSAVCFCLGITEVDPARMNLLFERFISRERDEPPDIDVDFEHERREEVIQYIYARYGRERAALAATVITYRARSALRDTGKALGLTTEQVEALVSASSAWRRHGEVLPEHLVAAGFEPHNPVLRRVLLLANLLRGFPRHLSQHVGGFVIARGRLDELVPIENAAMPERTVIQWEKDDLEALGLLKVDVLALGMLSAIRRCLDLLQGTGLPGLPRCMADIPAEDPAVYRMIQQADTVGVFQIESRAQMSMLPRLRPAGFYDLVIEVAIVRPGPIQGDMVHPYLKRRQGLEPVSYPTPEVRTVLERTLGVPIFQEQVIKLAMVAAGFTPGEADRLRRAMAAWRRRGGLEPYRARLMDGMRERGYAPAFAERVYRQILGFGEYGFPESHSASFALLVYVSAWLKCHHPAVFCAALINSQPMGFYQPAQLVRDARAHDVAVRPVDVLHSDWDCTLEAAHDGGATDGVPIEATSPAGGRAPAGCVHDTPRQDAPPSASAVSSTHAGGSGASHKVPGIGISCGRDSATGTVAQPALRLGLRMVAGLSRRGAQRIAAARAQHAFNDVDDLARRAELGRSDLRALAAADALAGLTGHRHAASWAVAGVEPPLPLLAGTAVREQQPDLFAPSLGQEVAADYAHTGLSLRTHPLGLLRTALRARGLLSGAEVGERAPGQVVRAAGLVLIRQRPGKGRAVFVTLEDETGVLNLLIWADLAERQRKVLLGAQLLGVVAEIQRSEGVQHLVCRRLEDHSDLLGGLAVKSRDFH